MSKQKLPRAITRPIITEATAADVDLEVLKDKLLEVLRRETKNLLQESSEGRLERDRSVALVSYLKYLNVVDDLQKERLSELTDEELKRQKEELNET